MIFTFIGDEAPTNIEDWTAQGLTGHVKADILFPETVAPGTKVFVTAAWFNNRKETSPAAVPVSAVINFGGTLPTAR